MSIDSEIMFCKSCLTQYREEGEICMTCGWCFRCNCDPVMSETTCNRCGKPACDTMLDVNLNACIECSIDILSEAQENGKLHAEPKKEEPN